MLRAKGFHIECKMHINDEVISALLPPDSNRIVLFNQLKA